MDVTPNDVTKNGAESRYEVRVGDDLIGLAEYVVDDGIITFTHTEVSPAFEGHGIGSTLIRAALDDVRATGDLRVVPLCPFVRAFIQRHAEYADLLAL